MRTLLFVLSLTIGLLSTTQAQHQRPREDDHFWRRRVLMRIDLQEKMNRPLERGQGELYPATEATYNHRQGFVNALLHAYQNQEIPGFRPDTLDSRLAYDEFRTNLQRIEEGSAELGSDQTPPPAFAQQDELGMDGLGFEDEMAWEDEGFGDDFSNDFGEGFGDEFGSEFAEGNAPAQQPDADLMFAGLHTVLEVIEDRIYDKQRSDLVHDVQYIRLVWVDPLGQLPERNVVAFRYEDLLPLMDRTLAHNRHNDAEHRSMRELFENRDFHAFIANLSGNPMQSLQEAEKRRRQMIEFEHNLYSY